MKEAIKNLMTNINYEKVEHNGELYGNIKNGKLYKLKLKSIKAIV